MLGGIFSDFLDQPWEQARGYVREELQQLRLALQQQTIGNASGGNGLKSSDVSGAYDVQPRYISNMGTGNSPKWDRVDLVNGVTGKISLARLPSAALSTLLGRGAASNGDYEPITLGSGLTMTGTTLSASGSGGGDDTLTWLGL